jgi:hypothetical protein
MGTMPQQHPVSPTSLAVLLATLVLIAWGIYSLSKMQDRLEHLEREYHRIIWRDTQERLNELQDEGSDG